MSNLQRPYLVIPKLIRQKTWGGDYIQETKKIVINKGRDNLNIGQSYELFSGTKLALGEQSGLYEVGSPDSDIIDEKVSPTLSQSEYIDLETIIKESPVSVLGEVIISTTRVMPLLLKMTQAKGNSFQIHIKPGVDHPKWQPKAETWYFFNNGQITRGVAKGISLKDYQEACRLIDSEMKILSNQVTESNLAVNEARAMAKLLVEKVNPWQFVQNNKAVEGQIFDMSQGGIHHSWEEDLLNNEGNILYEIQQDRMDPISTIRAFDQGKIDDQGNIREVNIDDYFKYIDTSEELNQGTFSGKRLGGNNAFTTNNYAMDILKIDKLTRDTTNGSFCHYYVKSGQVEIETDEGKVVVKRGWSCFIPAIAAKKVRLNSIVPETTLLKTYVPTSF